MQVKVWNDDENTWTEEFKGENILIPPRNFIMMSKAEANQLVSQYSPVKRDGTGRELKPKKLRIEMDPEEFAAHTDQPYKYKSSDGMEFRTMAGMKKYEEDLKAGVVNERKRSKAS